MSDTWRPNRSGPYIAVDCGLFRHRKLEGLSSKSIVLLLAVWCHCGDELTDGHVSTAAMRRLRVEARAPSSALEELRSAGLLIGHGPWEVPGYLDWNPTRAHVEGQRQSTRERVARHRAKRRQDLEAKPTRNAASNALRNGPRRTEVDTEQVLGSTAHRTPPGSQSRPHTTTPHPDSPAGHPDTLDRMALVSSSRQLLDRLRQGTGATTTHEHDTGEGPNQHRTGPRST